MSASVRSHPRPSAAGLAEDAPVVGVVLQKYHINTGDAGHYVSLISELEARGAKVVCIYSGGLDFSGPDTLGWRSSSRLERCETAVHIRTLTQTSE